MLVTLVALATASWTYNLRVPSASAGGVPTGAVSEFPNANAISPPPDQTPEGPVFTIEATEDATVYARNPRTVGGNNKGLWVDVAPLMISYLKFQVDAIDNRVLRTTLMMQATTDSPDGFSVYLVPNATWSEATITFETAPTIGVLLGSTGRLREGSMVSVELDPFIDGPGNYTVALLTDATTRMGFGSTESEGVAPRLVIRTEDRP